MTASHLSQRALRTPPSPIRKLAHLAREAKARGTQVFHLNIGQPDLESPPEFLKGLALYHEKVVAYEDSRGNAGLLSSWARFMRRSLGVDLSPEHILITTGASEALVLTFMVCCDPGDEVLVFDPTYANYLSFAAISGVTLRPLICDENNGFALPPIGAIEAAVNGKTRSILVCNPNNPTGTVYSRNEIAGLVDLCVRRGLFLVVDETYREFVYDGLEEFSVLQLAPGSRNIVVVDSLSKRFSLCGARIGCLITANEEVQAHALSMAQARLAAPTIEQFAAAHLLDHLDFSYLTRVKGEYARRRDTLMKVLRQIKGIIPYPAQGAFYCLVRLPVDDVEDFAKYLLSDFSLDKQTTMIAPAAGFYISGHLGHNVARIAYVVDSAGLERSVQIIGEALKEYSRRK